MNLQFPTVLAGSNRARPLVDLVRRCPEAASAQSCAQASGLPYAMVKEFLLAIIRNGEAIIANTEAGEAAERQRIEAYEAQQKKLLEERQAREAAAKAQEPTPAALLSRLEALEKQVKEKADE